MFSIDDDEDPLDAMFSSIAGGDSGAPASSEQATNAASSSSVDDDLSWLDDDTGGAPAPASGTSMVNTSSVDDFLSEVFGENANDDLTLGAAVAVSGSTAVSGDRDCAQDIAEITAIVDSAYPDVEYLRQLITSRSRTLPASLRAKVWCLLLIGHVPDSSATEAEIAKWDMHSSLEMNYKEDVAADCRAVFNSALMHADTNTGPDSDADSDTDAAALTNVLAYHCVKFDVAYSCYYSSSDSDAEPPSAGLITSASIFSVLYPLVALQRRQRQDRANASASASELELLSQCYCALQAHFYPLMQYQASPAARELTLESLCSMVRLLLRYHCPVLANKLDAELPDWWRLRETPGRRHTGAAAGFLCETWLVSFFCGTLPPEAVCLLLDWCILTREPLAGVYAVVALLYVFAEPLLVMDAAQLAEWFDSLAAVGVAPAEQPAGTQWFRRLAVLESGGAEGTAATAPDLLDFELDMVMGEAPSTGPLNTAGMDWTEFMNGWLAALQSVRQATPVSFRRALDGLEEACAEQLRGGGVTLGAAQVERDRKFSPLNPQQRHLYVTADEVVPSLCSRTRDAGTGAHGDCKERFFAAVRETRQRGSSASGCVGLFPQQSADESEGSGALMYFAVDCRSATQKALGSFPKAYALDCSDLRTDSDGELDAASPALARLLEVLGPLADCSHICLLGAGHNTYLPGAVDPQAPAAQTSDPLGAGSLGASLMANPNINALSTSLFSAAKAISQQVGGLGGQDPAAAAASYRLYVRDLDRAVPQVANFFVRRCFRRVSILEGGYTAALRHLHGSGHGSGGPRRVYNVDSILIDVDKSALQSFVLGRKSLAGISWRDRVAPAATPALSAPTTPAPVGRPVHTLDDEDETGGSTWTAAAGESTATARASPPPAPAEAVNMNSAATVDAAKQMAGAIGKRLSIFGAASLDNIKKGVSAISAEVEAKRAQLAAQQLALQKAQEEALELRQLEEEEARARVRENPSLGSMHGAVTTPQKSEQEREMALAQHTLAGVRVGDSLRISRETLPGAVLFPALVYLPVDNKTDKEAAAAPTTPPVEGEAAASASAPEEAAGAATVVPASTTVGKHRFLVVTPERFIILDAQGGGVGTEARVDANHHLTELLKITFRKRDPELVNIFFVNLDASVNSLTGANAGSAATPNAIQFRVVRRKEFVEALQKNMQRFR
jgi:hypothetical protein